LNGNINGQLVIEGKATIIRAMAIGDNTYLVKFDNGDEAIRFIDPAAQKDPKKYISKLETNPKTGGRSAKA